MLSIALFAAGLCGTLLGAALEFALWPDLVVVVLLALTIAGTEIRDTGSDGVGNSLGWLWASAGFGVVVTASITPLPDYVFGTLE